MKYLNPKIFLAWLKEHWRGFVSGTLITALAVITLSLQIGTLIEGQNQFESDTITKTENLEYFKNNLVNAPYYLPALGLGNLLDDTLMGARIVSVLYALLATALLLGVLTIWFNLRIAAIGSLLFITSAWVLSIAHQAAPFIMLVFTPLLLLYFLTRLANQKEKIFSPFILLIASIGLAAYIPYMIWFIVVIFAVIAILYKNKLSLINADGLMLVCFVLLIIVAPLAYSLYTNPDQIRLLLGIPQQLPTITEYLERFTRMFASLFVATERLPELFIYQKPLLDIFSSVMMILGIYHFYRFMPKRRKISISVLLLLLIILIPLQSTYLIAMAILIPFIFLFIPAGINEMIRRWYFIFPRNPIARTGAAILLVSVIGLSVTYNLQKYYIAWPNTPETKSTYMIESIEE